MKDEALGLIETVGLAAAVEAADTCLKSARVTLVGYELSKGMGLVTVKIKGDVSAVQAALSSAKASADKVNKVYSVLLIPRPSANIDLLVNNSLTVGNDIQEAPAAETPAAEIKPEELQMEDAQIEELQMEDAQIKDAQIENAQAENPETVGKATVGDEPKQYTCNICKDPICPRIKGAPRKLCIHFEEFEGDVK